MRLAKLQRLPFASLAVFLVLSLLSSIVLNWHPTSSAALSGSDFNPGRIIDDSVFFADDALSVDGIQSSLTTQFNYNGTQSCDLHGATSIQYHYNTSTHQFNDTDPLVTTSRALYTYRVYAVKYPSLLAPNAAYDNDPFNATKPSNVNANSSTEDPWFQAHAQFECLFNFQQSTPAMAADSYCDGVKAGTSLTAAQIIYRVAHACHINAKVLIVTLEKEEGLVTDNWPWSTQYRIAMGFACPDTSGCDSTYYGFFNQIYYGARQFQIYAKRPDLFNYVAHQNNKIYYNPNSSCGYKIVNITNQATAGLYNYTPYVPNAAALSNLGGSGDSCSSYGNRNFWVYFNDWFGNPTPSPCNDAANVAAANMGRQFLTYKDRAGGNDYFTYSVMNQTGSGCTEVRTLKYGYKKWAQHYVTAMPATDPTSGQLLSANVGGDGRGEMIYMKYGNLQIHELSSDFATYPGIYDVKNNLSGVDPSKGTFVAGDFFGRGYDQVIYLRYRNGQGYLEVHMLSRDLRQGTGVYDVATGLSGVSATSGVFVAGDFFHKGYDQLAFVKYGNSSRPVEVHLFSKDLRSVRGTYDVATGLSGVTANKGTFVAGNFDGRGDQILYFKYASGSGYAEIHAFSSDLRSVRGTYDTTSALQNITLPL